MTVFSWLSISISLLTNLGEWVDFNDYHCIEMRPKIDGVILPSTYYLEGSSALLALLSAFGDVNTNVWDLNDDGLVGMWDVLLLLSGYGTSPAPNPNEIDLSTMELFGEFGEGNNWFELSTPVSFNQEDVSFIWYHTTPYDEVDVMIQAEPNSFDLDIVMESGNILTYTYVRK
tara:strand:+ start:112 stop:630 length:519 start_codon:yes stop_codon:yes gene_type:complete